MMISFFHKIGTTWVAKAIFTCLSISMLAFWGLGGISNTNISDGTAIHVGNSKISMQELSHSFDQERNKMSKISGSYISPKQALSAGLLDQVIQQLIIREMKKQIQEDVGLTASDQAVRKYIEQNPVFRDNLGHFDANLFYAYLSQLGINQNELAKQMRSELAFKHLTNSSKKATPHASELMNIAAQSRKEQRQIESVFISTKELLLKNPKLEELQDYYEAYKEEFSVPEYRKLRIVTLTPDNFIENSYDKMYETSRQLEDLLGAGIPLKEACLQLKITNQKEILIDVSGKNKQGEMLEPNKALLEEAFSISKEETTSLIDFNNGFMVAEVEEIIPMGYKPFDSVRGTVQKLWETEERKRLATTLSKEITDRIRQNGWDRKANLSIISKEKSPFSKKVTELLFKQGLGNRFVQSIPTEDGFLVAVVKKIIPSNAHPTQEEIQTATNDWENDLSDALQASYAENYSVNVNQSAIQKQFSVYQNESD